MTPPRSQPRAVRSRQASALGICILIGAFVGCTPVSTDTPRREAHPLETRPTATAEEVYRSYIDPSNEIDLADPETFAALADYATERFHADVVASLTSLHERGFVVRGKTVLMTFEVKQVFPDHRVEAMACSDMSSITMFERNGEPVKASESLDAFESLLEFTQVEGELRINHEFETPVASCTATGELPTRGTPAPEGRGDEKSRRCVPGVDALSDCEV